MSVPSGCRRLDALTQPNISTCEASVTAARNRRPMFFDRITAGGGKDCRCWALSPATAVEVNRPEKAQTEFLFGGFVANGFSLLCFFSSAHWQR